MRSLHLILLPVLLAAVLVLGATVEACAAKPTIGQPCAQCHTRAPDVLRGTLGARSEKFSTINVNVGNIVWVIKYDANTAVEGADSISSILRDRAVAVAFTGDVKTAKATAVSVKQPYTLPEGRSVGESYVQEMAFKGATGYIIDSRPMTEYLEGHIPGAVSLPYETFDRDYDRVLPRQKDSLLVFYSGGFTSMMSPESARKAEALGYTNVKVFTFGFQAWKIDGNLVVSEPGYVMDMQAKDIAHVVVDLRKKRDARKRHIKGAVNITSDKLERYRDEFPKQKGAPIILYTAEGVDAEAFGIVRGWGYKNASVLNGGASGWTAAGGELVKGKTEKKIVYEPRPLPGTVTAEEFKRIVDEKPADKLVIDVRDADEVEGGMLPGAVNIPMGELAERIKELPKDKEIIIHSRTGIRAMMAHEALGERGYNSRYLNEVIQVAGDGSYEITK
jgi:rhodanese-related sulfurtransferase